MASIKPKLAWIATIMAGSAVAQSVSLTATINITQEYQVRFPVAVHFLSVSADPVIKIYPSSDGGNTFDTDAMTAFSVTRVVGGKGQKSITLSTGQYAIQLQASGPNTQTIQLLTQQILTAYESV